MNNDSQSVGTLSRLFHYLVRSDVGGVAGAVMLKPAGPLYYEGPIWNIELAPVKQANEDARIMIAVSDLRAARRS